MSLQWEFFPSFQLAFAKFFKSCLRALNSKVWLGKIPWLTDQRQTSDFNLFPMAVAVCISLTTVVKPDVI